MFRILFEMLEEGNLPDRAQLAARLRMAVVKKMGVLRMPPSAWPADSKINPSGRDLVWAAALVGDEDTVATVVQLIALELLEKGGSRRPSSLPGLLAGRCDGFCRELEELAMPHAGLVAAVRQGCDRVRRAAGAQGGAGTSP
ncbi:MAG: hypothetical protein AB1568_09770 [Thermodesulfobacteriota bacterium]